MNLILDAGAFIAVERGDRSTIALAKRERLAERSPLTHGGVVAQIWRGGSGPQVAVARLLGGVDVKPLDERLGRHAGALLDRSRGADAVDSALVCLAQDGDVIATSDPTDLRDLADAAGLHIDLIPI